MKVIIVKEVMKGDVSPVAMFFTYAHMGIFGQICPYGTQAYAKKIWSSGVSPKKASQMQLIDVVLRSVGHSSQKLWQKTFFSEKMPCILPYNAKKISNTISSLVRNLAQKAKWSKIFRRKRIQKPFRTTCGKVSFSNLYGFSPLWIKRCFYNSPA